MHKSRFLSLLLIMGMTFLIFSCEKDESTARTVLDLPSEVYDYESIHAEADPDHSGNNWFHDNTPFFNQVSNEGATLGRVLFYDKRLSQSNKTSCASCHKQALAFADGQAKSQGFFVEETKRNSPHIINMKFESSFFWDAREVSLEDQVLQPIEDHVELGMESVEEVIEKIHALDYYPALFEAAFGSEEITSEKVSKALAQFVRSIISTNTKFDQGMAENFQNFTPIEQRGLELFFGELPCGSCHSGPDLGGNQRANIGLDMVYEDNGMGDMDSAFDGWFSVPTLRNIALTAPYMHDGRFETLEEVVDHYTQGVQNHHALSPIMRLNTNGGWGGYYSFVNSELLAEGLLPGDPLKFNLSATDKEALIAFLNTLTDEELIHDVRFSDPFVRIE